MKFSVFKNKKPLDEPLENFEMLWTAQKKRSNLFQKKICRSTSRGKYSFFEDTSQISISHAEIS